MIYDKVGLQHFFFFFFFFNNIICVHVKSWMIRKSVKKAFDRVVRLFQLNVIKMFET